MKFVINDVVYPSRKLAAETLYNEINHNNYPNVTYGEILYELGNLIDCDSVSLFDVDVDAIASNIDEISGI